MLFEPWPLHEKLAFARNAHPRKAAPRNDFEDPHDIDIRENAVLR
jgi:hypothetical protein